MFRSPKLAALGAGLATCVALALPGAASATVQTPVVEGTKVTINSTEATNDTITLAVVAGNIAVNNVDTTLPADGTTEIVVNAGEGDDVIDASALALGTYKSMVLHGDAGNDSITGGAIKDELFGDAGNDRLIGFKGNDEAHGGEGNDLIVWNNGDGTDPVNDGEGGVDEVEINGSPTAADEDVFKAVSNTELHFERTNLVKFAMEIKAERMTINGLGGNDTIAAAEPVGVAVTGTVVSVNGGSGDDKITGADGADLLAGGTGNDTVDGGAGNDTISGGEGTDSLNGGEGNDAISGGDESDTLEGGPGDDRLVGDRGTDNLSGEAGDDVMVWNNGDASDQIDGGAGFDRAEENGGAAGDQLKLSVVGGTTTFERTNLVPFTVKFVNFAVQFTAEPNGGVEAISVNGLAGDDTFAVALGVNGLAVTASGDAGNDTLTGGVEADSFFGGTGNDTLNPGAGNDLADGGEGDDTLMTRDNAGDLIRGGAGSDSAQTDATSVDAVEGVERLDATKVEPADTKALLPKLGKVAVKKSGKSTIAMVPLSCPAAETGGCKVELTLVTAKVAHLGSVRAVVVLGSKTAKLAGGKSATVPVRSANGAAALAKGGKLAAHLRIASSDAAGNTAVGTSAVSLHLSE